MDIVYTLPSLNERVANSRNFPKAQDGIRAHGGADAGFWRLLAVNGSVRLRTAEGGGGSEQERARPQGPVGESGRASGREGGSSCV